MAAKTPSDWAVSIGRVGRTHISLIFSIASASRDHLHSVYLFYVRKLDLKGGPNSIRIPTTIMER